MDLNINNYSIDELYTLFNLTEDTIDVLKIKEYLSNTIELITIQDEDGFPENKEKIITFYKKAAAKLINTNIKLKHTMDDSTTKDSINYFKENEEIIN